MPNTNPTIVSASLSDKELQDSINKMVANFDKGLQTMLEHSNEYVGKIQESLQKIGNTNFGAKGSNDGGVVKRTKAQNAETEAVEKNIAARDKQIKKNQEVATSFDQMAAAIQKASRMPSEMRPEKPETRARDSYYAFVAGLKEQSGSLAKVINDFERGLNNAISKRTNEINNQITASKNKIQELNQELNRANATRNASRASQVQGQLDKELRHYKDLELQLKNVNNEFGTSKISLAAMNAEHHRLANLMREETSSTQQQAQAQQQLTQAAQRNEQAEREAARAAKEHAEQVKRMAEETRIYLANEKVSARLIEGRTGGMVYAENDARAKGLTIEQQIDAILRQEVETFRSATQNAQQQLGVEQQITKEYEKRRNYKAPQTSINESFRRMTARTIGVDTSEISSTSTQIAKMTNYVKQLEQAYSKLTDTGRRSPFGVQLREEMQMVSRTVQKLRSEMSRPINLKSVMGLSEKTLDDMAYKMRQLQSYKMGLNVKTQVSEMQQVDREIVNLKKRYDELMGKNQSMIASNTALGRSWNYMKNRLAFYFTVGASTQFIKNLIEVRSQYELLDRSIGILIDDARRGSAMFRELSEMALKSPFTLIELGSAAKQLVAYNIAAEDVVDTTRRLADMAAAVGLPIERLTYALGQVKAYGYLNSRDARIFLNAGIPIVQMLADMYNKQRDLDEEMVTAGQVREMMQKRLVSYSDVMKVVNEATDEGGRFFNFQEKAADTLKVRLANLNLAWNNLLNDIGKSEQGTIQTGIKGLTVLFQHWRELYRVIGTVAVAFGAYKTGALLASLATSQLTKNVVAAGTATKGLAVAIKSIPFAGWVSIIASVISYLFIFNDSLGDVGRRIQEITKDIEGFSKKMSDMYVKALSTDKLSDQLEELRNMINSFKNEFGVTIPVNLEDVNEGNIKAKIKEVKDRIDSYLAFTSVFTTTGAENERLKTSFDDFGNTANNVLNLITTNLSLVKQGLLETGKTAKDVEILDKKEGESTIAYLQRIVKLYEDLGLLGKVETRPYVGFNPLKSVEDNTDDLIERQEQSLTKLGIKNKEVFKNMMENAWDYYKSLSTAEYQFERFVKDLASKIDINSVVDKKERTLRVEAAIDKYTAQNGLNQTATELMKYLANQKFGVEIAVGLDPNAKKNTEEELQDWQKKLQQEADKNKIKLTIAFTSEQTPVSYAQEALTKVKDAMENVATLKRKKSAGTATQEDVDKATDSLKKLREQARLAGADLSSLDKKGGKGGSKKDVLGDALTKEVQLIGEIQKRYKEYQQIGVNAQEAIRLATEEYDNTLKRTNATLAKYGISTKTSEELAGMDIRDVRDYYKSLLEMAKSTGNAKGIEAIEKALANINVEITKLDYKKITDSLNNELGKLKDEYELAVELDANPEMGGMFADMMGIDTSSLPHTFGEAFEKANEIAKEKLKELKVDTSNFNLMSSIITADKDGMWMGQKLDSEPIQKLIAKQKEWRDMFKKNLLNSEKMLDDFVKKYGDYSDKVAEIESNRINQIKRLNDAYYTEEMRRLPEYYAKLNAINQGAKREESNAAFEEFKNSRYYTMMFENLDYISTKTIRDMRDRVRELMDTMNDLTPEQLKTLISQYEKLEQKLSKRSPFRTLTKDLREYFSTIDERKEANKEFRAAQKEYDTQTKVVAELKKKYENAIAYKDENYDNLDELLDELDIQQEILDKLKEKLKLAEKTADKYNLIKKLVSEEAAGAAKVISANLQSLGELRDNLQESFGVEFSEDINNVIDGLSKVGDGINKITSSAMSGDVVGALSGVASVVKGFGDAILGGKKDYFTPMKEAIEGLIAVMEKVADYQLEALGKMTGSRAVAEYRKLLQNNNKVIESYRNLAHAAGESGSSAGSHSYAARTNKSLANDWKEISRFAGQTVDSVQDLYDLSSEQLKDIMTNMPTTWLRIDEDIRIALEGIIEYGDKAKEYADALGVALTNISLDDLTNDFENMLQDMNVSSKDFADNFEDYMRNAIIRSMMAGTYTKELENWYKNFQEKISDDTLSQSDIEQLRAEYMSIVERALDERDKYLEVIGSSGSKDLSALQQGIQSISESTAESLAAYMNGVSQQVYYQSDVLTQIRDTMQSFDIDAQTGTLSEMLLQLQQSYQVQMSIQNILQGVLTPSGQGFRVELLS